MHEHSHTVILREIITRAEGSVRSRFLTPCFIVKWQFGCLHNSVVHNVMLEMAKAHWNTARAFDRFRKSGSRVFARGAEENGYGSCEITVFVTTDWQVSIANR